MFLALFTKKKHSKKIEQNIVKYRMNIKNQSMNLKAKMAMEMEDRRWNQSAKMVMNFEQRKCYPF